MSTTSKQNAGGDVVFVWQDQLVYAINCPVMVKGMTENNTATENEGVIVCHNISKGKIESYSVHFTSDECSVWVELGVNESRVGFRRVEVGGMGGKAASTTNITSAMKVANGAQSFIAEEATNNNPCSISIIAGEEGAANGHADDPEGNTVSLQNVEQCPNDSQLSSQKKSVPPHEAGAKGNENAQSSHISQRAVNNDQSSKVMGSDKALVNAPPCLREPQISLGKRKQPDASSLSSNSRSDSLVHTEKTPRASEGAASEATSFLTVPFWLWDKCRNDKELFCK